MATIEVHLTEADILAACKDWAVTRVLNEGRAIGITLRTADSTQPRGQINGATVFVETDRMKKQP